MKKPGLTDRQRRAILALCETATKEAAARLAGVSRTALFDWLREKPFQAELQRVRGELYAEGLAVLKASTSKAAGVLLTLLDAKDLNTRRLAAGQVLQLGLKAAELEMTETRLAKLEAILAAGSIFGSKKS
ncbi:MAG: hypothetical protein IMZ46_05670 [Acidobacteria bacterium]|nr:hypothetical protein [Acidobacteriota bacterium]